MKSLRCMMNFLIVLQKVDENLFFDEGLDLPVGQTPPQPFQRAKQKVFQPERTHDQLKQPDGNDDEVDLIIVQLAIVVETITKKEQGANDGMCNVIGEGHSSYGGQSAEQFVGKARLVQEDEGGVPVPCGPGWPPGLKNGGSNNNSNR
jgi:hypothetical protein